MSSKALGTVARMDKAAEYERLAERVGDFELRSYYRGLAKEARESANRPAIEKATRDYLAKLADLGVILPPKVTVEIH